MTSERIDAAATYFLALQGTICSALEEDDGAAGFETQEWTHAESGGGTTRVIQDGGIFEKGAVNFSRISLLLSKDASERMGVARQKLAATGISLILHPRNPYVPTVHMNFRCIELENGDWWFGGGSDLTPFYLFEEDARHFHSVWKTVCERHNPGYYGKFKAWCDRYFFITHRAESRGIGGIFFDNLTGEFDQLFRFVRDCGDSFLGAYHPIIGRRSGTPFGEAHRRWQLQRRGRYAEFNLVYDRGTKFGLDTGGRIESILVSLPPLARWDYEASATPGTDEEKLLAVLKEPRSWA